METERLICRKNAKSICCVKQQKSRVRNLDVKLRLVPRFVFKCTNVFMKGIIPCYLLRRALCDCSRVWTCQRWLMRTIINARWYRFQNYGTTSRSRETDPGCCRDDCGSCTRRWRTRLIQTSGGISARSARNPSRRATRCIGIIDTSAIRCRVISAPIVATSASGPTRSTIISGSSIRDRTSRWTSSTSPVGRVVVHVGNARMRYVRY